MSSMKRSDGRVFTGARAITIQIVKDTLDIIGRKGYVAPNGNNIDIGPQIESAIAGTVLHEDYVSVAAPANATIFEVVNETTMVAARRLLALGKENIVALNFADGCAVGGGFLVAAKAQEEDLCRASSLYACLLPHTKYYSHNGACGDEYYTDDVIYSPEVPFFRDDNGDLLDQPYPLSIITAPAPNLAGLDADEIDHDKIETTFRSRAAKVLRIAAHHGHRNIVLGAWGCGAFGNDPEMVAAVFKEALAAFPAFEHVTFAIWDKRVPPVVFEAFRKAFELRKEYK